MARWKKALIVASIVVGALSLVLFGGGALLDGNIELAVEKRLSSPPATLFRFLDNQPGLDAWWGDMTVRKKLGPQQGQGLAVELVDDNGKVTETWLVKSSQPPSSIVYQVDFAGAMTVTRTLTLVPDGDGARVKWAEQGNIERPAMRWLKVLMPPETIIDNFDRALGALDRVAKN